VRLSVRINTEGPDPYAILVDGVEVLGTRTTTRDEAIEWLMIVHTREEAEAIVAEAEREASPGGGIVLQEKDR
jgi:hypothetical protein